MLTTPCGSPYRTGPKVNGSKSVADGGLFSPLRTEKSNALNGKAGLAQR